MDGSIILVVALLSVVLIAVPCVVGGSVDTSHGDRMAQAYFIDQTRRLNDRWLAEIDTLQDWEATRPALQRQLLEMLGLDPLPPRTDLKATITARNEHDDFVVENLHFQSMPGLYVTANLYLPKNLEGAAPTVLYTCGHGTRHVDGIPVGAKVAYQRHGIWYARNGYVCLILDTLQLGEIEGIHHGSYNLERWWWWTVGYTPLGVEVWNNIRAIDYLLSRAEVDGGRIAKTGRSGGGAYSWYVTAVDDRIATAMPAAGIADMRAQLIPENPDQHRHGAVGFHCDCMFHVNTQQWEFAMIAALAAPRPVLLMNTDADRLSPYESVLRLYNQARQVWALHGRMNNWQYWIGPGGHIERPQMRLAAYRWTERLLRDRELEQTDLAAEEIDGRALRVFDELPADQINTRIDELFVPAAHPPPLPQTPAQWQAQRRELLEQLNTRTFAAWPADPPPLDVRVVQTIEAEQLKIEAMEFTSQAAVRLRLWRITRARAGAAGGAGADVQDGPLHMQVLDSANWGGFVAALRAMLDDAALERLLGPGARATAWPAADEGGGRQIAEALLDRNRAVVIVAPRGVGPAAFTEPVPSYPVTRGYYLLGQTIEGMGVWDVRRALAAVAGDGEPVTLGGTGRAAGVALYAALYEPSVRALDLSAPPPTHRDGPILLNVRRFMDMPQAVAMAMQPRRRIRLVDVDPQEWRWPMELRQRLDLPDEALEVAAENEPRP